MSQPVSERQFYAETYDVSVPDRVIHVLPGRII
jgi:hypothetical protein